MVIEEKKKKKTTSWTKRFQAPSHHQAVRTRVDPFRSRPRGSDPTSLSSWSKAAGESGSMYVTVSNPRWGWSGNPAGRPTLNSSSMRKGSKLGSCGVPMLLLTEHPSPPLLRRQHLLHTSEFISLSLSLSRLLASFALPTVVPVCVRSSDAASLSTSMLDRAS